MPRVGDVVTFSWAASASRHSGIILRVREDVPWGEVSYSVPSQDASGGKLQLYLGKRNTC